MVPLRHSYDKQESAIREVLSNLYSHLCPVEIAAVNCTGTILVLVSPCPSR
jgi:hypothetical protein